MSELPGSWTQATLEELFEIVLGGDWGKDPDEALEDSSLVRCIRAAELRNWDGEKGKSAAVRRLKNSSVEKRRLRSGDILVEISGGGPDQAVGRTALITPIVLNADKSHDFVCTNFFRFCRPSRHMDATYLNLYLQHFYSTGGTEALQGGSNNLRNLRFPDYLGQQIPIPPLNEQVRIVAKIEELFSELDKGVESLITAREQLKAYRQAVLKHAFEGKLTADWRLANLERLRTAKEILAFLDDARSAALDMNGHARRKPPATFDSTDLPECPAEWALASMDSLCHHITSGSRDWSRFYDRGSSTFIMAQNVRPGRYDGLVIQNVDPPMENAETERTRVQIDDVLVTIVGANTGDVCRFPLQSKTHYVCQSVALMRLSCPEYSRFVELYFQSQSGGQRQYRRYIYGAGRPHLSFEQLKQTVVPIPDAQEAAQIVSAVDSVFSKLEAAESAIDAELLRTARLRQAVLRAAFSGRLVVQDANDEPAPVLLERIRSEQAEGATKKRHKNGKKDAA